MMNDPGAAEAAAIRLAELAREIDDLDDGRAALLKRLDIIRADLQRNGQSIAAMRASIDLLCEHVTNVTAALAELRAIEEEIMEMGRGLQESGREASGLAFEATSLQETLEETDDELERLSSILIGKKVKAQRGH